MADSNLTSPGPRGRHYIVVVHGIGEQKLNQTTTPVVHRFAEVRQKGAGRSFKNLLPAYLSAQSVRLGGRGHGWSEFNGIPVDAGTRATAFDGTPATDLSGENFRFVDLHWQHILQSHQKRYASGTEVWARSLLSRIENSNITPEGWLAPWALSMLNAVVKVVLPIKTLVAFKYPGVAKMVFDDFLGDVHLYGDYSRTRGQAVRHFHVILDEITIRDFIDWCRGDRERMAKEGTHAEPRPYQKPQFTVIAHSLGSMLSFDALVYAHAKDQVRRADSAARNSCPSLPFLGYTFPAEAEAVSWKAIYSELEGLKRQNELADYETNFSDLGRVLGQTSAPEIPLLTWRGRVKNFITIGSPIDKYHVIWWQKYLHMGLRRPGFKEPTDWRRGVDDWLDSPGPERRIHHHNFCDEQDPVGHHLDVARGTTNYKKIFDCDAARQRDVVFRRYAKPGAAHNMYWEDKELFRGFIEQIIDGGANPDCFVKKEFREGKRAFRQALLWAYFRVPFIAAILTGTLVIYARSEDILIYRVLAGLAAVLLWVQPNLVAGYRDEANPEEFERPSWKQKLRTCWLLGKVRVQRGILARAVAGMVQWRRILLMLSEGSHTAGTREDERLAFQTDRPGSQSFWWRWAWRVTVAALALIVLRDLGSGPQGFGCQALISAAGIVVTLDPSWCGSISASGIIFVGIYLLTMAYVVYQFLVCKYFR